MQVKKLKKFKKLIGPIGPKGFEKPICGGVGGVGLNSLKKS